MRRLGLLGPLLAVAVALVPTSHARLDTPANERGSRNILLPERGIYLGAFVGGSEERPYQNVLDFEALIGRKLQIDNHYYGWPATFPGEWEGWDAAHGRIPMATWNGAPLDEIVSGRWDTLIRDRARAVKAFGGPLFLRFEMNGDWLPCGSTSSLGVGRTGSSARKAHSTQSGSGP